jgi:hypothetical protein
MNPSKRLINHTLPFFLVFGLLFLLGACQNAGGPRGLEITKSRLPSSGLETPQTKLYLILDIDWTLVSPLSEEQAFDFIGDQRLLKVGGEFYLLKEGARELLEMAFSHPDIEVSFFSGGTKKRNINLLREIILEDGLTALQKSYKVLSKKDLTLISKDEALRFSEKFKKDLSKVHHDLKKVLLIEDLAHFALGDGVNQTLWLGQTFYPPLPYMGWHESNKKWQQLGVENRYLAPTKEIDWWARRKLFILQAILERSRSPREIIEMAKELDFSELAPPANVHYWLDQAPLYQRFIDKLPCSIPL